MDRGAVFISVTSAKPGTDMSSIFPRLQPLINRMIERGVSIEQPNAGPGYFCTAASISFWSEKSFAECSIQRNVDPEGNVPAHGFFFDTKFGKIAVFASTWRVIPG